MQSISKPRLHLLRAMYVLLAVGLGLSIWPSILFPDTLSTDSSTVVRSMLGAIGALSLLGIVHPLRMLPLLFFELGWKILWIVAYALPLWWHGQPDDRTVSNFHECAAGVVLVLLVTPWDHVYRTYVRDSFAGWRRASTAPSTGEA